jgi:K+-sensing histidine kinase KdpD
LKIGGSVRERGQQSTQRKAVLARVAGIALPVAVAVLLVPVRGSFAAPAAALLLVAVIVAVAALGDRIAGYGATVAATLSFDFFLTRPYERLEITQRADLETAICLFAVGVVVTEILLQSWRWHRAAREESSFVGLIHRVAELVTSGASRHDVIAIVNDDLVALLHLRACRYEAAPAQRPRTRLERNGDVLLGGRLWGADELGLPGRELELPVHDRGLVVGRFVLTPTPAQPVSQQRRVVAVALSDQVGAVLRPHLRSA